jgi:hypothetical protein
LNPEHRRARFVAHLTRAVPGMVRRGQATLVQYRRDGQPVAVDLLLVGHRVGLAYLYGFRPDLRRHVDVTQLLLGTDLEFTQRLGLSALSMLRGDEPHKRQWRPCETHNQRLLLTRASWAPGWLYVAGVRVRYRLASRLASLVKTRLPRLARS